MKNGKYLVLGIESSCDDTSASVVAEGRELLSLSISSQIDIHSLYGGVVPEIASRNHLKNINTVIHKAVDEAGIGFTDIDLIGVTCGPGLIGALLVGVSAAKAMAFALDRPIVGVHHLQGHIAANYIAYPELTPPFLCLAISGGNTLIVDGVCPADSDKNSPDYPCSNLIYAEDPKKTGVLFRGVCKVVTDGAVCADGAALRVLNATCVVLLLTIKTSYNGFDKCPATEGREYKNACMDTLRRAESRGFDLLLQRHRDDYGPLYGRVSLDLRDKSEDRPTDERLHAFRPGSADCGLYELLFNYGRYLLLASSRPGSLATNLQGIWNNSTRPPWNSNYTVNINTEMNYWGALPCNLPETITPLVQLIRALAVTGKETARQYYHASGFVAHHNADIWGFSAPVRGNACWGFWPGASGWLCRSLYELFEYTQDKDFLRETALPLMKQAALFYLDLLTEDTDGTLMICPATSPENSFLVDGARVAVAKSTAMMNRARMKAAAG